MGLTSKDASEREAKSLVVLAGPTATLTLGRSVTISSRERGYSVGTMVVCTRDSG